MSFYTPGNMEWPHLIDNALKAHYLYRRDYEYMVENDEIIIVDEFTGRKMIGRQWSDGLHQAVEAKERVKIKEENQTLATITLQNFFKLYKKLAGMTGTAMTEANEFWKVYKLDVVAVPTNRALTRQSFPDAIYRSDREKLSSILEEIREVHAAAGRSWSAPRRSRSRSSSPRCSSVTGSRTRCSTPSITSARPRSSPSRSQVGRDDRHEHGRPRDRHHPGGQPRVHGLGRPGSD